MAAEAVHNIEATGFSPKIHTEYENDIPPSQQSTAGSPSLLDPEDANELTEWPSNAVEVEDVPPDGGYGWVCCVCLFLINVNTWGINSSWAIFLAKYLSDSTFPGATQLEYALIGGLSISQCLLITPLVAISNRKFGTRPTMVLGACLVALAWLGASFATKIWHLFLSVGLCFGYGMSFIYVTATAILPQWFLQKRSLAVGLASSGAGLGGLAYNLGTGAAVPALGLQWTYRVLAICSLVCNLPCAILLRDRNKQVKPSKKSFDMKEFGKLEVNLIIAWGFLTELGYIVLLFSLPHYAASIGLTPKQGSIIGAMLNLGLAIGRPLIGYTSDRWGRINVAALVTALCGLFCLVIWLPAHSYGPLLLFALLAGMVCAFWGTVTAVTAEVVGLKRLPSSFGIICISLVLPTTFAEALGLQIVSSAGYAPAQAFIGVAFLLAAVCVWILRSWKLVEVDMKAQVENGDLTLQRTAKQIFKPSRIFSLRRV